jgi:hypothetical protein
MEYFEEMMDHKLDLSQIRDRGSKKWVAMMLPEHVKLLREFNEAQKKVPKPELDEWDLHAIEETLNIALKRKCEVLLKLWRDGNFELYGGVIDSVNLQRRTLELDNPYGLHCFNLADIVDVTVTE